MRYGEYEEVTRTKWGVWQFEFKRPLRTIEDAQWALDQMVQVLRPEWERWGILEARFVVKSGQAARVGSTGP